MRPAGGCGEADGEVQQRGLARAVGPHERHDVARRDRQGAVAQRPRAAVALAQARCGHSVHDTATRSVGVAQLGEGAREERDDVVVVEAGLACRGDPGQHAAAQRGEAVERQAAEGSFDERPQAGLAGGKTAVLQLSIRLEHRVRVDGEVGHDVLDSR